MLLMIQTLRYAMQMAKSCVKELKAVKGTVIKNLIQITVATFFKYKIKTCTCI